MLRLVRVGSVTRRRASAKYEKLLRRRLIVGVGGAELTRWLALRDSLPPRGLAVACFLVVEESRSVMEKERLGRAAS